MEQINIKCGERVREMRMRTGLTQRELSKRVGMSKQQICNIETGHRALTANVAIKLSKEFLVDDAYLLCRTDDKKVDSSEALKDIYLLFAGMDSAEQKQILDELYDYSQYLIYKYKKG
jgi:transcriptional regulator with XRE-family HTH domain